MDAIAVPQPQELDGLDDEVFRQVVRQFLRDNYPEELRNPPKRLHWDENKVWYHKLAEKGWLCPGWPKEHGGLGLSLACACDTIVAADDARLGAGFGRIGLMADLGLPHTLPLRVGQGRARQILLYHEQMTAAAAERIGLVDHVVPKGHALDKAMEKARFLAEQAPAPMALTKQLLGEGLDRALEQERHFQSTLFLTEDFAEGRAAFLGKRQPEFKGG